ncbi:hypothetical protein GL50803_003635 [Giardia duodenalis]|uniref:Uncharacterized protein n=1 Tax=Giardia intestinalis (strain ATCC 50803 / WB clone C6) TaxID=184922 RepID=A8BCY7_GIAIC|nr:hypothetical protein GL50803_003635 [Giardia intestinalis]KAE8304152.1 hypothetical protein GL50803_003635 [Giardia intestinalis]|eukprot:XP_001707681.1 Hypothetical protein GL50803_3635 [Giardia lamblia ATCC 50803]
MYVAYIAGHHARPYGLPSPQGDDDGVSATTTDILKCFQLHKKNRLYREFFNCITPQMSSSGLLIPPELQTLHVELSESDGPTEDAADLHAKSTIDESAPATGSDPFHINQSTNLNDGFSFTQYYTPLQDAALSLDTPICIGHVESIVGSAAMVKGTLSAAPSLEAIEDADKPFFIEGVVYTVDGVPTGQIVDVWGSVDSPIYTIQLTASSRLQKGDRVLVDHSTATRAKVNMEKSDSSDD